MDILILIEPAEEGRFRATAGAPFGMSAEADSPDEAARRLESLLRGRLQQGSMLARLTLGNGTGTAASPRIHFDPLPKSEWFFDAMREAIVENRKREDEAAG
jgi:hypothetical protein